MQTKTTDRPFTKVVEKLRAAGVRPTRQRMGLGKLLFEGGNRHITAEVLHGETEEAQMNISLSTVYNTLHHFTTAGLLREVIVDSVRTYFDTNTTDHHHYFLEKEGCLQDIPEGDINIEALLKAPAGMKFSRVDVIIHVAEDSLEEH